LIDSRNNTIIPIEPKGVLSDYIPFFFTVKPPMLYVIKRKNMIGVEGDQGNIIYLMSSIEKVEEMATQFVFTDRNAVMAYANFYRDQRDLSKLDWSVIKSAQWGRDFGEERIELKQAEFLAHWQ